ncbi:MAG: winged helix-turn-helix domain-containing protein [Alphaproteobacteria bacterium]|nr:winged helix-turn-helix domain-containing protein [Alphaproteobacteria bacterium]
MSHPVNSTLSLLERIRFLEDALDEAQERIRELEKEKFGIGWMSPGCLKLTPYEERIISALMVRDAASKDNLMAAVYADRFEKEEPSIKIIDVFVCKLRQKLSRFDISIETIWGRGYKLTPEAKQRINDLSRVAA